MNKKVKKIFLFGFNIIMLIAILTLSACTVLLYKNQNNKVDNEINNSTPPSQDENESNDSNENEKYPESSIDLQRRVYPFKDENYKYMYANIHRFFYTMPDWDKLISYRNLLSDYQNSLQEFNIKEDVLYDNLKKWVINAIYQHNFFKNKIGKLSIKIEYNININLKRIFLDIVWWFDKDYSYISDKYIRYWDQVSIKLANI